MELVRDNLVVPPPVAIRLLERGSEPFKAQNSGGLIAHRLWGWGEYVEKKEERSKIKAFIKAGYFITSRSLFYGAIGILANWIFFAITVMPMLANHVHWNIGKAAHAGPIAIVLLVLLNLPFITYVAAFGLVFPFLIFASGKSIGSTRGLAAIFAVLKDDLYLKLCRVLLALYERFFKKQESEKKPRIGRAQLKKAILNVQDLSPTARKILFFVLRKLPLAEVIERVHQKADFETSNFDEVLAACTEMLDEQLKEEYLTPSYTTISIIAAINIATMIGVCIWM